MKNLEHISRERKKALETKETIARHGRLAGILTSIGAGWLFGHFGPGHHAPADGADSTTTNEGAGPDKSPAAVAKVEVAPAPAETVPVPAPAEAVPVAPAHPTSPDGLLVGATIHRPGEGFGEMIQEFKHNFHEQLSVIDKPAPALAYVLDSNPNDLTHELLVAKDGTSLTMQPGDQFVADENQNIWFQRMGGEPQLVYENDPTAPGGFVKHEIHGHMQADAVRPEAPTPEVARAVPSEGTSVVQEDPSAALNRAQLGGSPIPETLIARTDYADGAGVSTLSQPESLDTSGLQVTPQSAETPVAPPAQPQAPETAPAPAPEQAPSASPAPETRVEVPHTPAEALAGGVAFTNGHNVEITPATPEIYYSPSANGEVGYMYGGPGDTAFKAAQQYVEDNPGTSIRFFALHADGRPFTGAFFSDASGASHPMITDPATRQPFVLPDLDAVTRKVDFNYRPVR